jgi:hypothetical protein
LKNVHYNAPFIQQGFYKPMGDTLREALLPRPEIYGNIAEEK